MEYCGPLYKHSFKLGPNVLTDVSKTILSLVASLSSWITGWCAKYCVSPFFPGSETVSVIPKRLCSSNISLYCDKISGSFSNFLCSLVIASYTFESYFIPNQTEELSEVPSIISNLSTGR